MKINLKTNFKFRTQPKIIKLLVKKGKEMNI